MDKKREYKRTLEMLSQILSKPNGLYYALAFLYDSGYQNKDLGEMSSLIHPNKNKQQIL